MRMIVDAALLAGTKVARRSQNIQGGLDQNDFCAVI
jgi:hypothetical protein